jgi:2-polyprenyl-3-methyl-5-hydroxy-6-metoxy-1,4-benzoquinol methylase
MRLASRHLTPELMDQPGLDPGQHRQALDGLRRVNRMSATSSILWSAIQSSLLSSNDKALRVLDIACGGGDVAIALAAKAKRAGIAIQVEGCDISPVAIEHARQQAERTNTEASFFQHDVLQSQLPQQYDVVTSSLFLHHLSETEAIGLMQNMAAAARSLVLIDDLRRTRIGYLLAWAGCRLLSRSSIVHYDGPQSVVAAFSLREVQELAKRAGMDEVNISRHWPQRYLLSWRPV